MSSSCSSILVIQIPTTMDSVMTQKMVFKPLNLNFHRGIQQQLKLNHRVLPLRCSNSTLSSSSRSENDDGAVVLHVRGMMCEGCASSVKKILETQPQVLSATVNLASETALVSLSSDKTSTNWQKQLGETLAHHLTTCGFTSTLRGRIYYLQVDRVAMLLHSYRLYHDAEIQQGSLPFYSSRIVASVDNVLIHQVDAKATSASNSDVPSVLDFLQLRKLEAYKAKQLRLGIAQTLILEHGHVPVVAKASPDRQL